MSIAKEKDNRTTRAEARNRSPSVTGHNTTSATAAKNPNAASSRL